MTNAPHEQGDEPAEPSARGLSWGAMLGLLALAIAVAAAVAYRLVYPFFHQHQP